MGRKITRKGLVKKLDKLVFEIVKQRDGKCVTCGKGNPTPSHLFSRKAYSTRWDLENVHVQCWPCNFKHTAHDSHPFTRYCIKELSLNGYDALHRKFVTVKKYKDFQLEDLVKMLQEKLDE